MIASGIEAGDRATQAHTTGLPIAWEDKERSDAFTASKSQRSERVGARLFVGV